MNSQIDRYFYARPRASREHFHPFKTWNRERDRELDLALEDRQRVTASSASPVPQNQPRTSREREAHREYSRSFPPVSLSMMAVSIWNILYVEERGSLKHDGAPTGPHNHICSHIRVDSTHIITAAGSSHTVMPDHIFTIFRVNYNLTGILQHVRSFTITQKIPEWFDLIVDSLSRYERLEMLFVHKICQKYVKTLWNGFTNTVFLLHTLYLIRKSNIWAFTKILIPILTGETRYSSN